MLMKLVIVTLRQILLGRINQGLIKWVGHVARLEETTNAYNIWVGKA
jgi:hypothetical protein